jgi:hypothetical protein
LVFWSDPLSPGMPAFNAVLGGQTRFGSAPPTSVRAAAVRSARRLDVNIYIYICCF